MEPLKENIFTPCRKRPQLLAERLENRWLLSGDPLAASLLKDIVTIPNASNPANLTPVGATTYFTADDGKHDAELWKTDGTAAGTTLVKDFGATTQNAISDFTDVAGRRWRHGARHRFIERHRAQCSIASPLWQWRAVFRD